jgi:hypothetical protein
MANGQGGRRTPGQPAPVSGPGRLSKRTDGGPQQTQAEMTGMPYGENAEFNTLQGQAPMSAAGQTTARAPRPRQGRGGGGMGGPVPLFSPTQRPDEPVTAGAPFGPGEGPPTSPGRLNISQNDAQLLSRYMPDLMVMAQDPNTPDGFKRFVRHLRNAQGGV